jgi:hypothetical protein
MALISCTVCLWTSLHLLTQQIKIGLESTTFEASLLLSLSVSHLTSFQIARERDSREPFSLDRIASNLIIFWTSGDYRVTRQEGAVERERREKRRELEVSLRHDSSWSGRDGGVSVIGTAASHMSNNTGGGQNESREEAGALLGLPPSTMRMRDEGELV